MVKQGTRGFTLAELMIVVTIIGVLIAIVFGASGGCSSDWTYSRKVTGQVVSIGGRFVGGVEGGETQKAALGLTHAQGDKLTKKTAGDGKKMFVDCSSTRCFSLEVGECVELSCRYDHRWNQPDVIDCKVEKVIECLSLGIKPLPAPTTTSSSNPVPTPPMPVQNPGEDW